MGGTESMDPGGLEAVFDAVFEGLPAPTAVPVGAGPGPSQRSREATTAHGRLLKIYFRQKEGKSYVKVLPV